MWRPAIELCGCRYFACIALPHESSSTWMAAFEPSLTLAGFAAFLVVCYSPCCLAARCCNAPGF
jgi:hypothetical protein